MNIIAKALLVSTGSLRCATDDVVPVWHKPGLEKMEEARQQLALREITGGAK